MAAQRGLSLQREAWAKLLVLIIFTLHDGSFDTSLNTSMTWVPLFKLHERSDFLNNCYPILLIINGIHSKFRNVRKSKNVRSYLCNQVPCDSAQPIKMQAFKFRVNPVIIFFYLWHKINKGTFLRCKYPSHFSTQVFVSIRFWLLLSLQGFVQKISI